MNLPPALTALAASTRTPALLALLPPVLTALAVALVPPAPLAQDNVLLIIADDVGVDRIGVYDEHPSPARTPTLDAMAEHGLLFRWAYSDPVCSPTRTGMLTGRYGVRTGVTYSVPWWNAASHPSGPFEASLAEVTLPEVLAATHRTAAIGKWHLATNDGGGHMHPIATGFELFLGAVQNLAGPNAPDPDTAFFEWDKTLADATGWTESTSHTYATTDNVDDALDVIDSFGGEPWFLWLAFNTAHTPFHAPPDHLHTYDLGDDPSDIVLSKAMVEAMDSEIERLLASMRPVVRARTTVIFLGDNGTPGSVVTAPLKAGKAKGTVNEGGVRVPLIVWGKAVVEPGREIDALVNTTDLFATILDLCGVPRPGTGVDSVSLYPYIRRPDLPPRRDWVYSVVRQPNGFGTLKWSQRMVRNDRYKLIAHVNPPTPTIIRFHDLQNDPWEDVNLWPFLNPTQQAAYNELRDIMVGIADD